VVDLTKLRRRIERDYQQLKQEVRLGHFEGREWRGFQHNATLCIAAYGPAQRDRDRSCRLRFTVIGTDPRFHNSKPVWSRDPQIEADASPWMMTRRKSATATGRALTRFV
jgi:hypothetical protein